MQVGKQKKCLRCGHTWRSKLERPKHCPGCKQPKWDTPARVKKISTRRDVRSVQGDIFDAIGNATATRQEALQGLLLSSGLSESEFAGRIGTTSQKLAPYLNGEKPVTEVQLAHVRAALK